MECIWREKSVYYIHEINIFEYCKLHPMKKTVIKLLKRKQSISDIYSKYNAKRTKCMAYTILN
jgi:hypothetical protein